MQPDQPPTIVVRTWIRDGSTNHMPLEAAVQNIIHNTDDTGDMVRDALLAGRCLYTKRASFLLAEVL